MEKPFIKPLRSPYHCYFYEVNRNEIVRVDADVFAILEKVLAGASALEDALRADERVERIAKMGYLSCKRPSAIYHPMLDKLENLLARKVEKITLQLTQRCNFRCKYCAYFGEGERQRAHANKMMSLETALQAIDFYFEHSRDMRRVNIGFYGGEPCWRLIS